MIKGFLPLLALLLLSAVCMTPALYASPPDSKACAIASMPSTCPVMVADYAVDFEVAVLVSPPAESSLQMEVLYNEPRASIQFEPERSIAYRFSGKDSFTIKATNALPVTFARMFRPPRC
jgi:hypothetical protein